MAEVKQDHSINIDELIKSKPSNQSNLIISDDENVAHLNETPTNNHGTMIIDEEAPTTQSEPEKEYKGSGIVVSREEYEAGQAKITGKGIHIGSAQDQSASDGAKKWLKNADDEIAKQKAIAEKMIEKGIGPKSTPQEIVNIYLSKEQVGNISFTEEQQRRIEMADKIVLNEVKEVKFNSIRISRKSVDKDDKEKRLSIIKRAFDRTLSPFIALSSGYMGKMGNCSTADIMKLGAAIDMDKSLQSELDRWSLLYDKMKYCSIGKFETFDDFLKGTAYDDYENLQFALLCASFPEKTSFQFTCQKCKKKFVVAYDNSKLIRTENIDETTAEAAADIIKADTFIERAKEVHEKALFNQISRISINDDDNSILLDLYMPSAYDAIYRTYSMLDSSFRDKEEYRSYVELVKMIKAGYIINTDESVDGEDPIYDVFEDPDEILTILTKLNDNQLNKIAIFIGESYLVHKYHYGIDDVVCTNPECKHHHGPYSVDMDRLLFFKLQR